MQPGLIPMHRPRPAMNTASNRRLTCIHHHQAQARSLRRHRHILPRAHSRRHRRGPGNWPTRRISMRSALPTAIRFPARRRPCCCCLGRLHLTMTDAQFDAADARRLQRHQDLRKGPAQRRHHRRSDPVRRLCPVCDVRRYRPEPAIGRPAPVDAIFHADPVFWSGHRWCRVLSALGKGQSRTRAAITAFWKSCMPACRSAFYGKYRAIQGGQQGLERERRDLHEILRRVRPRPGDDLSPHWRGLGTAAEGGPAFPYRSGRSPRSLLRCCWAATSP